MYRNAQHAEAAKVELGKKVGAGLVAGCLAVSMLPAVAFAAPGQSGGPGQIRGGQQPAQMSQDWQQGDQQFGGQQDQQQFGQPGESQFDQSDDQQFGGERFNGQQPGQFGGEQSGDQQYGRFGQNNQDSQNGFAPRDAENGFQQGAQEGQQPPAAGESDGVSQGQPNGRSFDAPGEPGMPGNSEIDARIIAAIPDDDVRARAEAGNPDAGNLRPAIPEGEVNVQQIIDTIRQALMKAGQLDSGSAGQASMRMGDRQFAQMPDDIAAPSDSAAAPSTGDQAQPQQPNGDQAAPTGDDTSALALFQKIVATIKTAFGL